jgi:hypothetical protein
LICGDVTGDVGVGPPLIMEGVRCSMVGNVLADGGKFGIDNTAGPSVEVRCIVIGSRFDGTGGTKDGTEIFRSDGTTDGTGLGPDNDGTSGVEGADEPGVGDIGGLLNNNGDIGFAN